MAESFSNSIKRAVGIVTSSTAACTIPAEVSYISGVTTTGTPGNAGAKTTFNVIDKNSEASLLELKPITGRKHQLRKQLYAIGHPIFGDTKYKLFNYKKGVNKNLMLHSYEIKFMIKEKKYTFRDSLRDYFKKMLKTKRLNFEY